MKDQRIKQIRCNLPEPVIVIGNNNLYFFSWGAFIMSFYVLFGFLQNFGKVTGPQVYTWAGLTMTSFVVFVTAARQYDDWSCDEDNLAQDDQCQRTSLAISVGVISGFVGLIWAFLGHFLAKQACEQIRAATGRLSGDDADGLRRIGLSGGRHDDCGDQARDGGKTIRQRRLHVLE